MQISSLESFLPNLLGSASKRDPDEEGGDDLERDGAKGETAEGETEDAGGVKRGMDEDVGERRNESRSGLLPNDGFSSEEFAWLL